MKDTKTAIHMKEILSMAKLKEKEFIIGLMEKYMMENGSEELKMAMACGKVYLVIAIWDNGKIVRHMAMEYINGKMVIGTKDIGMNV